MVNPAQRADDRRRCSGDRRSTGSRRDGDRFGRLAAGLQRRSHFVFAWRGGRATAVVWEILLGVVYGAIGFYLLTRPVAGLASLTLAVAVYLFVEGVLEFILSLQLRPAPGSGWLLVDGIVTLVLAVMIWSTWPSSAAWVIGTLVGISMLFSGITRLMLSLAVRKITA
jgi:uncharacterized membrane protein HdeD (DUF308 family)